MNAVPPNRARTPSGPHYQIFLFGRPPTVRWRLLSGNNRDMCHGISHYRDIEDCAVAIAHFIEWLPQLQAQVKRDDNGQWTWLLSRDGRPIAEAGHSYDRRIRCDRAIAQVYNDAAQAAVGSTVVVSEHRRWQGGSRSLATATPSIPLAHHRVISRLDVAVLNDRRRS